MKLTPLDKAILDALPLTPPGVLPRDLVAKVEWDATGSQIQHRLVQLVVHGEVERHPAEKPKNAFRYWRLASDTATVRSLSIGAPCRNPLGYPARYIGHGRCISKGNVVDEIIIHDAYPPIGSEEEADLPEGHHATAFAEKLAAEIQTKQNTERETAE